MLRHSTSTSGARRRIWLGSAAAVLVSAATVAVLAAPSQAILPPPGQSTALVEDFYEGNVNNIIGQIFITGCMDTPAPPSWGDTTGPLHYFKNLPCGPDTDPSSTPPIPPPSF